MPCWAYFSLPKDVLSFPPHKALREIRYHVCVDLSAISWFLSSYLWTLTFSTLQLFIDVAKTLSSRMCLVLEDNDPAFWYPKVKTGFDKNKNFLHTAYPYLMTFLGFGEIAIVCLYILECPHEIECHLDKWAIYGNASYNRIFSWLLWNLIIFFIKLVEVSLGQVLWKLCWEIKFQGARS